MNIAVIAAQGRSGQAFVKHALEHGHSVRAGIRSKITLPHHPNLVTLQCDATNEAEVINLILGQDAVVTLIGHVKGSPPDVQTTAMATLLKATADTGLTRLVSLTGTGVRLPGDRISLINRFLNFGINLVDPSRVQDGINHIKILQESSLDWTAIRVLKLENLSPKPFRLTAHGPAKTLVSREEVAEAILQVLTEESFMKEAPIVSSR